MNYHISRLVLSSLCAGAFVVADIWWCSYCRLKHKPNQISNTQRTENKTTDVVIQQQSRKLLKMDILMSETCWAHKKWNKIASGIKLVFHSSTITMMHGRLCCWITTSVFLFSVRCVLEIWCGWFWVVLVLQAEAQTALNLQHTTNWEQDDWRGNSTTQSQALEDGYTNVRNTLSA